MTIDPFYTVDLEKHINRLYDLKLINTRYDETLYLEVAAWGDYCGSIYDRANSNYLLANFPDEIGGHAAGYGSTVLYLHTRNISAYCAEMIIAASKYADCHVIDEDYVYEIEEELRTEAWDGYMRSDIKAYIEEFTGISEFDETFSGVSDEELRYAFERTFADANCDADGYAETATSWAWGTANCDLAVPALVDALAELMVQDKPAVAAAQLTI